MLHLKVFASARIGTNGTFSVIIAIAGYGEIKWDGGSMPVKQGNQLFLPAAVKDFEIINHNTNTIKVNK